MGKKKTSKEFIEEARYVHGDKYDYSNVEYKDSQTKVCIICPKHGEFWQRPYDHLNGRGCIECGREKSAIKQSLTKDNFIEKAKKIHGDKYDYSKVKYVKAKSKVCIICPIHGEFWQTPANHLQGQGCPRCSKLIYDTDSFIKQAKKIHGNKYNYSKVKYKNNKTKVCIICHEHGEFEITPNAHLNGQGCKKCGVIERIKKQTHITEDFIKQARIVHGDKYDYSKVEYTNAHTKVCIICPIHGEFWQIANDHLNGCGCPICKESKLEKSLSHFLIKNNIHFEYGKSFEWLGRQHLDFYLPEYNIAIECQGKQHFIGWGGKEEQLKEQVASDEKKFDLCKSHNIKILYYTNIKEIKKVSKIYNDNIFTSKVKLMKIMDN